MQKVQVFNIREYFSNEENERFGEEALKQQLSEFFCDKNTDVEKFLKEQSIDFTRKNQSVTYLVFSSEDNSLLGYFTIAIKPISVPGHKFSNTINKRIARVSKYNAESGTYTLAAYLIAQLGKNFSSEISNSIDGEQLLQAAIETIKELQYMAGGVVVFLEAEENKKLMEFYEAENGFKRFDTRKIHSDTEQEHTLVQLLKVV